MPNAMAKQAQARVVWIGRAVGPRPMSGCGPGTRATCSAVLSGALEAYPLLGTTPGVLGGELVAGYRISPGRRYRDPFCNAQKSIEWRSRLAP